MARGYRRVVPTYIPVRDSKSARQSLNEQLDILDREMREGDINMSSDDTKKLLEHGRFFEQKFNQ